MGRQGLTEVIAPPRSITVTAENLRTGLLATWWPQNPGGNWYWRCTVPERHLPGQALALAFKDLRPHGDRFVMPRQQGGTAIWCYPGNAARGIVMAGMQAGGFRVLIEVDDNYLISHAKPPGAHTDWVAKVNKDDVVSTQAHRRLAEFVDGIIVTTEELARAYREVNDHVYVCPNSVELQDWDEPEKPAGGVLRIGYAASHSHWYDANDVYRALSWAAVQPQVEVVMLGLKVPWDSFPYRTLPWTNDLAVYRRSLQALDVGLCPLRPSPWALCKSDIKALEYSMAGAATVVSRTEPYGAWCDQPFALTADSPKGFLKHLKWCVANRDGVKELAAKARAYVLKERLIEHHIWRWRDAVA